MITAFDSSGDSWCSLLGPWVSSQDHSSHLLPQRRQDDQEGESEEREGGEERGAGGAGRRLGTSGCGGGRWGVGILVAALAGHGLVPLVRLRTAEVAEAHVLTSLVTGAGQRLELLEILISTTPLAVTARSGWT